MVRKMSMTGLATAVLIVFAAQAYAGSATCKSTKGEKTHTASDGSTCLASSDGTGKAKASEAFVDADQKGVATANATGGSFSNVTALGKCNATGMASGGSTTNANCSTDGSFVHSTATGGGEADGDDINPPTCTPNGGTAKVRSSGGNCG
jgi:hypothetical protein